jgi:putative nucleotidyltransferase with HDIG domain
MSAARHLAAVDRHRERYLAAQFLHVPEQSAQLPRRRHSCHHLFRCDHRAASDASPRRRHEEVGTGRDQARAAVKRFGPGLVQSGLLALLELRLPQTYAHAQRVARSSVALARAMSLLEGEVRIVRQAALLHDIGKLAVPARLIGHHGALTDAEVRALRMHVDIGAELVNGVPSLAGVGAIIAATHERFDGCGYPCRLAGEEIPLAARIISVADSYDAMVTRRPYRDPMSHEDAHHELVKCSGSHFDPAVVREWVALAATGGPISTAPVAVPIRRH